MFYCILILNFRSHDLKYTYTNPIYVFSMLNIPQTLGLYDYKKLIFLDPFRPQLPSLGRTQSFRHGLRSDVIKSFDFIVIKS